MGGYMFGDRTHGAPVRSRRGRLAHAARATVAALMLFAVILVVHTGCVAMPTSVVDEARYLRSDHRRESHAQTDQALQYRASVSDTGAQEIPLLITAERHDLALILLIDLRGGAPYQTIEYQRVDDDRGSGHIVILYDHDGVKYVYHSPSVTIDPEEYYAFGETALVAVTEIDGHHRFERDGMIGEMSMTDAEGRRIRYTLRENAPGRTLGGLVAPVAGDVEEPTYLPFIYMDHFGFSPHRGTDVLVTIDDVPYEVASLPLRLNGTRPLLIRYSLRSPVMHLNKERDEELSVISVPTGTPTVRVTPELEYSLEWNQQGDSGRYWASISEVVSHGPAGPITIRFSPPIPNPLDLKAGEVIEGRFSFHSETHRGIFAGEYVAGAASFVLQPRYSSKPPVVPGRWWREYTYVAEFSTVGDNDDRTATDIGQWIRSRWDRR